MNRNASRSHAEPVPPPHADPGEPRHGRRVFDKILVAFHHACDANDLEVSERLLAILEIMATRRARPNDGNRRRILESLVAAHERLWHLRHPISG